MLARFRVTSENAEGLAGILRHFFNVPFALEQFVGHWMRLEPGERTFLGRDRALGIGAWLARRWDRQHKFPASRRSADARAIRAFSLAATGCVRVVDWVAFYFFEHDWDMRLLLHADEVPRLALVGRQRLGWTTWLGTRRERSPAGDLRLHAPAYFSPSGASVT